MEGLTGLDALGADAYLAQPAAQVDSRVGERLKQARTAAGMSGTQLGQVLGLGRDQVSKIESGKRRVSLGELALAASALGTSVRALLGATERPHLALAARLATGAGPEVAAAPQRRARQLLEIDDLLTRAVGLPAPSRSAAGDSAFAQARSLAGTTPRSVKAAREQGEQAAAATRSLVDLGQDGLRDLPALCEQHFGADVALAPWGDQADGLCVHSGDAALLLASTDFPLDHQRFTLAHELAHHLFADPREVIAENVADMFSDELVEKRASAFAGHLLMPREGVKAVLADWLHERPKHVSDRSLVVVMEHFGVSFAAMIFQLNLLGWLTFEDGQERKQRRRDILFAHRDATRASVAEGHGVRRAPERLVRHALRAARNKELGLSIVATLLERADDDQLWREVMGAGAAQGTPEVDLLPDDEIDL